MSDAKAGDPPGDTGNKETERATAEAIEGLLGAVRGAAGGGGSLPASLPPPLQAAMAKAEAAASGARSRSRTPPLPRSPADEEDTQLTQVDPLTVNWAKIQAELEAGGADVQMLAEAKQEVTEAMQEAWTRVVRRRR